MARRGSRTPAAKARAAAQARDRAAAAARARAAAAAAAARAARAHERTLARERAAAGARARAARIVAQRAADARRLAEQARRRREVARAATERAHKLSGRPHTAPHGPHEAPQHPGQHPGRVGPRHTPYRTVHRRTGAHEPKPHMGHPHPGKRGRAPGHRPLHHRTVPHRPGRKPSVFHTALVGGAYSGTMAQQRLWASQLARAAAYAHIPENILWGVYGSETDFGRYISTSSAGAKGLMQFIESTARQWHYPYTDYPNSAQSQNQFTAAALYLRALHKEHGDWNSALLAYSGGGYGLAHVEAEARRLPTPKEVGYYPAHSGPLYYNPLQYADVTPERIDQGVDYAVKGGYLIAIADSTVGTAAFPFHGWPGGFIGYQITTPGPLRGVMVYYAEGVKPTVAPNSHVRAGEKIADLIPHWHSGIEIGYASDIVLGLSWAQEHGGYSAADGNANRATRAGIAFSQLVHALGGPAGTVEGATIGEWPPWTANSVAAAKSRHGKAQSPLPGYLGAPPSVSRIVAYDDYSGLIRSMFYDLGHRAFIGQQAMTRARTMVDKVKYVTDRSPQP